MLYQFVAGDAPVQPAFQHVAFKQVMEAFRGLIDIFHRAIHGFSQLVQIHGFQQIIFHVQANGFLGVFKFAVGGNEHTVNLGIPGTDGFEHFQAIHARHENIQ